MMLTKHFTDSCRKVISCTGDSVVVEPEGGPRAVFRRPLTILQISDGIIRVLIHFTKTQRLKGNENKRLKMHVWCVCYREREGGLSTKLCYMKYK